METLENIMVSFFRIGVAKTRNGKQKEIHYHVFLKIGIELTEMIYFVLFI